MVSCRGSYIFATLVVWTVLLIYDDWVSDIDHLEILESKIRNSVPWRRRSPCLDTNPIARTGKDRVPNWYFINALLIFKPPKASNADPMTRSALDTIDIQVGGSWQDRDAVVAGSNEDVVNLHVVRRANLDPVGVRAIFRSPNTDTCNLKIFHGEEVEVAHFAVDRFDAADSRESHELESNVHR